MSCAAVNYRHFVVTFVLRGNWVRAKRRSGGVSKSGTSVSAIALCPLNDWTDYLKSIFAAMKYKREWCNSVKEWETLWCNKCAGCSIIPLWITVCDGNFFTQVTIDQCNGMLWQSNRTWQLESERRGYWNKDSRRDWTSVQPSVLLVSCFPARFHQLVAQSTCQKDHQGIIRWALAGLLAPNKCETTPYFWLQLYLFQTSHNNNWNRNLI